jgi:hypothetical protein
MPTLIRTRLISSDTRDTGTAGDISPLLEDQIRGIEVKRTGFEGFERFERFERFEGFEEFKGFKRGSRGSRVPRNERFCAQILDFVRWVADTLLRAAAWQNGSRISTHGSWQRS